MHGPPGLVLCGSHYVCCAQVFGVGELVRLTVLLGELEMTIEEGRVLDGGFEVCYESSRMSMRGGPGTSGLVRGGSFCVHASHVLGGSVRGAGDGVPSR